MRHSCAMAACVTSSIACEKNYLSSHVYSEFHSLGKRKVPLQCRRRKLYQPQPSVVRPAIIEATAEKNPPVKLRRVVVTCMGVETPLGHDPKCSIITCFKESVRTAGEIKSFSTDGLVAPKLAKRMDKFMLYMITAGKKALADGGVTEYVMNKLDKSKWGVLIGSAFGGMKLFSESLEALRISYKKLSPFSVPFTNINMGAAILSIDLGWMGPNYAITTACATGNYCILNAVNHIINNEAGMMLCGGSDAAI